MNPTLTKFLVGFSAALVVPIAKLYQQGLDLHAVDFLSFVGACIPIALMGSLVGGYAVIFKRNEEDLKKVFEVCILLPGVFVAFASGKPMAALGDVPAMADPAFAKPVYVQMHCEPTSSVQKGLTASYDALTNGSREKYWIVSPKPAKDVTYYVEVDGKKFFIISKTAKRLKGTLQYDGEDCKLLPVEN